MRSTSCTVSEFTSSFPYSGSVHNRSSNTAGAPLPIIPRRTSSSRSEHGGLALRSSSVEMVNSTGSLATLRANIPSRTHTPPIPVPIQDDPSVGNDSESSSTSATLSDEVHPTIIPRSKRVHDQRFVAVCPPENSTPTPALFKARAEGGQHGHPELHSLRRVVPAFYPPADLSDDDDTPRLAQGPIQTSSSKAGKLQLNLEGLKTRHASESHIDVYSEKSLRRGTSAASAQTSTSTHGKLIRKKSGEPVKSSLKLKRPGLFIMTGTTPSKSEPSTPTHAKVVHFDAKLEHIKLFLAEQKPLAVSRDGSPTTDTSGTDNEFPSFIYGDDDEGDRKKVTMEVPNMPASPSKVADVALQHLELLQDTRTINGRVRVRNIAFEKWLAIRFTFDWWQTTSEVTARYVESVESNAFDVFAFTIRLHDIWTRIEEKTLFLALKYIVAGQEFWDNNNGQNYLVKFSKSQIVPEQARANESKSDMVYLRNKLEQVVKGRDGETRHRRSPGSDQRKPPILTANTPLATRYDFGAALKHPWKGGVPPSPPRHLRTSTYPSSPNTIPWPPKQSHPPSGKNSPFSPARLTSLGSPREADKKDVRVPFPFDGSEVEDLPFSVPSPNTQVNQRRDYFEQNVGTAAFARRMQFSTSVTTEKNNLNELAVQSPPLPRIHSFPQPASSTGGHSTFATTWTNTRLFHLRGDNGSSSPSITSSSSPSPSPSPTSDHLALRMDSGADRGHSPLSDNNGDRDNYSVFLNRFCFYTGSDSLLDAPSDIIPRSHSVSSVEEFLWSQSPPTSAFSPSLRDALTQYASPSRHSPLLDDIRSGSSTPTAKSLLASETLSTPPIIG